MCFPGLVLSVLGCRIGLEDRECNRSSSWVGAVSIVFLEISEGDGGAEKVVDGLLRPVLMYFRNGAAIFRTSMSPVLEYRIRPIGTTGAWEIHHFISIMEVRWNVS